MGWWFFHRPFLCYNQIKNDTYKNAKPPGEPGGCSFNPKPLEYASKLVRNAFWCNKKSVKAIKTKMYAKMAA